MTTVEGKLAVMGGAAKINGKESLLKDPSCRILETRLECHRSVFYSVVQVVTQNIWTTLRSSMGEGGRGKLQT